MPTAKPFVMQREAVASMDGILMEAAVETSIKQTTIGPKAAGEITWVMMAFVCARLVKVMEVANNFFSPLYSTPLQQRQLLRGV